MNKHPHKQEHEIDPVDFHGAAIVNPDGSETPITEAMIKRACDEIERSIQREPTRAH